jgi:biotin carboxyl carrier protein
MLYQRMESEVINPNGQNSPAAAGAKPKRPSNFWLIIVAGLFIVVPFLAWYFTWFGRALSDADITKYLADEKNPRHIQHALSQLEQRIEHGDPNAKKFYPQITALTKSPTTEVRKTAAWVMGQDNKSEEFHRALLDLLKDPEPLVRRNAALQLVRFGDAAGRLELRSMLQPFEARSPIAGKVVSRLPEGSTIRAGALLARIRDSSGNVQEFRSPVDGKLATPAVVKEGDAVAANQTVAVLTPDQATVLDALHALAYVGAKEDLPAIESCAQVGAGTEITQQAARTIQAIRTRPQ